MPHKIVQCSDPHLYYGLEDHRDYMPQYAMFHVDLSNMVIQTEMEHFNLGPVNSLGDVFQQERKKKRKTTDAEPSGETSIFPLCTLNRTINSQELQGEALNGITGEVCKSCSGSSKKSAWELSRNPLSTETKMLGIGPNFPPRMHRTIEIHREPDKGAKKQPEKLLFYHLLQMSGL